MLTHLILSSPNNRSNPFFSLSLPDGYLTEYACEGQSVHIKCEKPGTVINLIRANYGRYSVTICNEHANLDMDVNCASHKTIYVMQNR